MIHLICKPLLAGAMLIALTAAASAQAQPVVMDRDGSTIAFEPYAPNIVRVTLSTLKEPATAAPGYGFVAQPSAAGWSRQGDVYRSSRLVVTLEPNHPATPLPTQVDIASSSTGPLRARTSPSLRPAENSRARRAWHVLRLNACASYSGRYRRRTIATQGNAVVAHNQFAFLAMHAV